MKLNEAKKIIFEKKPKFKDFYEKNKDKSWIDYINNTYPKESNLKDEDEFSEVFFDTVKSILGENKAKKALKSIKQNGFVSTADHHGLLCHPFFSNMAIAKSSNKIANRPETQIVLTVGAVSPTNSSFPRSIFFHDRDLELKKIHMISLKWRQRPLYGIPSISKDDFRKLKDYFFEKKISKESKKRVSSFIEKSFEKKEIWLQERFCEQLTILNDIWWKEIFGDLRGDLLYLEAEELVKNLLIKSFERKDSLSEIFFDENRRNSYLKNFNGIIGAHNIEQKTGSFLFWLIDEKENKRKALFLNNGHLETLDGKTKILLKTENLKELLLNHTLIPSMALCYSILAFHHRLTLGGGFSQIQYLGEMKIAWGKIFPEFIKEFEDVVTDIFSGETIIAGIGDGQKNDNATLADFLIHTRTQNEANELSEKSLIEIGIGESLDAMMYELYEIVAGEYKQIEDLPIPKRTINI